MKTILLQLILIFLIMGTAFSQQTETFEDETEGATSFTLNGMSFTTTGDLMIEKFPEYGCDQSDYFLGTGTGDGGSSGSFGSIKVTNSEDKFMISTLSSWCALVSATDGFSATSGDVKFTGTLSTGGL